MKVFHLRNFTDNAGRPGGLDQIIFSKSHSVKIVGKLYIMDAHRLSDRNCGVEFIALLLNVAVSCLSINV